MNHSSSESPIWEREFDYNLSRKAIFGWSLFFAASAIVFGYQFIANEEGLILNGVPLTPFAATVFYGLVAGVSIFCLGNGAWLSRRRGRIAFGKDALMIPKSWWSSRETPVLYRDLRRVRLAIRRSAITGATLLYVQHARGMECFSAAMFSSNAAFDEFHQLLVQKANQNEMGGVAD